MVVAEPEQTSDVVAVDELIVTRTGSSHELESTTDVPMRFREKKRLNWTGKTCESVFQVLHENALSLKKRELLDLAPLTTVGNLVCCDTTQGSFYLTAFTQPFRRLCVTLGADITCGESKKA